MKGEIELQCVRKYSEETEQKKEERVKERRQYVRRIHSRVVA